jgi:hypothetical protein
VSSESRNRIILAVFLGLLTTAVFAAVVASIGQPPAVSLRTLLGVTVLILILWAVLAPLALLTARRLRQLTVIDTVLTTIVLFLLLQILLVFTMAQGGGAGRIAGTPCDGGKGRKVVVPEAEPTAGAIYWSCVPVAEYEARRQAGEDLGAAVPHRDTAAEAIGRLFHIRVALRSLVFGAVAGLSGWFYAFGWCWRVRRDAL